MVSTPPTNPGSDREPWTRPTARVDWLAGPITAEGDDGRDAEHVWLEPPPERCPPDSGFHGYDRWRGDAFGTKIARATEKNRHGEFLGFSRTYLVLKGSGLGALRANGVDDREALQRFRLWGGRCKRIDLAVDVIHPEITPWAIYELHQKRHFVTRLELPRIDGDREAGQTFYLSGKHQQFRAYDKTAERLRKGVVLEPGITRLEMELRGPWAKRAFHDLSDILDREDWETAFPRFVCGVILSKARPLDGPKPSRNPQRAPVWEPLETVLRDVRPVRLSREDIDRTALQQFAGQALHFSNDLGSLRLMETILGESKFLQAIRQEKLSGHAMMLAALVQQKPEELRAILRAHGIDLDPPAAPPPPSAPQRELPL